MVARLRNSGLSQAIDREACATLRFIDGPPGDEPRALIDPLAQNDLRWGTLAVPHARDYQGMARGTIAAANTIEQTQRQATRGDELDFQ